VEFSFRLDLPNTLLNELQDAARESRCTPAVYAAETLEAALATRILPRVKEGRNGARVLQNAELEPDGELMEMPVHVRMEEFL
jgi:hypothetical protein